MLGRLFRRLVSGEGERRAVRREDDRASVAERRAELRVVDDAALEALARALRERVRAGTPTSDVFLEGLAIACELSRRRLGLDPFDEQVHAALLLDEGCVVEMATGEGKTLAAGLCAAVRALPGEGVHVITANDYLAARDAEWMRPIHEAFGSTVAAIGETDGPAARREAYAADVTHATANEIGFDCLRDHLVLDPEDVVQRPFTFAIVDEADSILLDEARIPLVVAGCTDAAGPPASAFAEIVRRLVPGQDFLVVENGSDVMLTAGGAARAEHALGVADLYAEASAATLASVNVALFAQALLRRDVDYVIEDGAIRLVDELKGRIASRRRWPDGIHAALEAKERLAETDQGRVLSSMTVENLVRLYPTLSGMSGTAVTPLREIETAYGVRVEVVAPHVPSRREDLPDRVFARRAEKQAALVETIREEHARRRPVLVGTASVAESEDVARELAAAGVPCVVLNARYHAEEAGIVAKAGDLDAVTISTNMAGRGTDIRLGGPDGARGEEVRALGGLLVIGTNRHESRRIDDQLRGRAGRQGDPGQSRFLVSLEDDLVQRYAALEGAEVSLEAGEDDGGATEQIARAQRVVEGRNHSARTTLGKYWAQLEKQRRTIHGRREEWLLGEEPLPFSEEAWARHDELADDLGEDVVSRAARQIVLSVVDRLWAEHLAFVADVREGIHLRPLAGQAPLAEFDKVLFEAFLRLEEEIVQQSSDKFLEAEIGPAGVDLAREGLPRPSSTWTYVTSDQVYGTMFERMARGLARKVRDMTGVNVDRPYFDQ